MALSGSQKAYTFARSGLARSGATRSNYVTAFSTVDLIVRDGAGNIISRTDITLYIRHGSLQVTQALNDEADTCSFQIVPTAPASAVPAVGQEIAVAWTPGDVLFRGYALVVQFDRREMNRSPWVSVQCQDSMWRFDARMVTYRFPAQSVSASIAFLVKWFCNGGTALATDFQTSFVQPGMPSIAAFDVVNQRPSTVMRTMTAAVQGAFYVDGLEVHAWAGSLSEPLQTNPQPLTNDLATLKAFRVTHDATQLRKRVLVEGRRTQTLIGIPMVPPLQAYGLGLPIDDATIFDLTLSADSWHLMRMGTQWAYVAQPITVAAVGGNPPQAKTWTPFAVGDQALNMKTLTGTVPPQGWIRVGNQYARYAGVGGNTAADGWYLTFHLALPYGLFTAPIPADETVEWVDTATHLWPHGLVWPAASTPEPGVLPPVPGDETMRAQPTDTPVVTLAEADRPLDGWPPLEGFVQDGRYSYAGALARAEADLDAFAEPLVTAEWETDDLNAQPGRRQDINLAGAVLDTRMVPTTLTITRVEISFPLRTLPPRRLCTGGDVKASSFLDLVLTDES